MVYGSDMPTEATLQSAGSAAVGLLDYKAFYKRHTLDMRSMLSRWRQEGGKEQIAWRLARTVRLRHSCLRPLSPCTQTRTCSGGRRRYLPPPALEARLVPRTCGLASCSRTSGGAADAAGGCTAGSFRLQEPCTVQSDNTAEGDQTDGSSKT